MKIPKKFKTGDIVVPIKRGKEMSIYEVVPPVFNGGIMMVKKVNGNYELPGTADMLDFRLITEKDKLELKLKNIFINE
jgi:hypothetical protein